jgi:hypothetical protein
VPLSCCLIAGRKFRFARNCADNIVTGVIVERLFSPLRMGILLAFIVAIGAGCSRESKSAKVQVYIPKLTSTEPLSYRPNYSGKTVSAQSEGSNFNSLINPTTLAEFNCFVVFVGGAGFEGGGTCSVSDGSTFKLGAFGGGVAAGSLLEMNVRRARNPFGRL